jgi:hypothetical protein
MSYGSPTYTNDLAKYEVYGDGPDVSQDSAIRKLRIHVTAEIVEEQDEAEADAAFQLLIDLINGSSDFVTFAGAKKYEASVSITATP